MYVLLMPVDAVLALEFLSAHRARKQVTRVKSLMLLESNLAFESLFTGVTLKCFGGMDFDVVIEVARSLESLAAGRTLERSPPRVLMHSQLMFPHIRSCDGSVATVGAQMRLGRVVMGKVVLAQMAPTFVGLCTGIDRTFIETFRVFMS